MQKDKFISLNEIIISLQTFWMKKNVLLIPTCDYKKGAGTLNINVILEIFKKKNNVLVIENCYRYDDTLHVSLSDNIGARLTVHSQMEVLLNIYDDPIELFFESLEYIGISREKINLLPDDWNHLFLKAKGIGWEARVDGLEIAQLTYFQDIGGIKLKKYPFEIAYGLERIAMLLQNQMNAQDIVIGENNDYLSLLKFREESNHNQIDDKYIILDTIDIHRKRLLIYMDNKNYFLAAETLMEISNYINSLSSLISYEEILSQILSYSNMVEQVFQGLYQQCLGC